MQQLFIPNAQNKCFEANDDFKFCTVLLQLEPKCGAGAHKKRLDSAILGKLAG